MTYATSPDSAKKANISGYCLLPAALRNFVRNRETNAGIKDFTPASKYFDPGLYLKTIA